MKGRAGQLPIPNSQLSKRCSLGVGGWKLIPVMLLGGSSSVLACPVCFGGAEGSLIDGAKLGVLALVAVTLAVQGAFVAFFLYLRKRAKYAADVELETEWLDLQRGSRPS